MSLTMEDKTIVVAGVGTGLGSQVGRLGLREGANVVLAARSSDTLESIAAELDPSGERVLAVTTDITDEGQCQRLANQGGVLLGRFRHKPVLKQHEACFVACAVIVQYGIENGSPLFSV